MPRRNPLQTLKLMVLDTLGAKPTLDSLCQVVANTYSTIDHHVGGWRQEAEKKPACRSGCASCCAQAVWVTEPEAIYLAEMARENMASEMLLGRVEEVLEMTKGEPVAKRVRSPVLCPFVFADNSCFVYGARPVACRGAYAENVKECLDSLQGGPGVHYFHWPFQKSVEIRAGMIAALAERGIRCHTLEFNTAMKIALSDPGAAERWIEGANAFEAAISPDQTIDVTLASQFAAR